ncbi:hypothetical protein, unlikely [Trypanosoma congolense IL3000]|uniref:Uncharacterized protein n=1 Tax=Trypanosoma congolense (strain IL3000) TaxID=1068625 RepID=F9W8V0_TRYCI|nr:hypothetical protein, unlikely [Trypanosoma congolense IL3000]
MIFKNLGCNKESKEIAGMGVEESFGNNCPRAERLLYLHLTVIEAKSDQQRVHLSALFIHDHLRFTCYYQGNAIKTIQCTVLFALQGKNIRCFLRFYLSTLNGATNAESRKERPTIFLIIEMMTQRVI